jgi:hypothetical protein
LDVRHSPELLKYVATIIGEYGLDEGIDESPLADTEAYFLASAIQAREAFGIPGMSTWDALSVLAEQLAALDPQLVADALINQQRLSDDMLELNNAFIRWTALSEFIHELLDDPDYVGEPLTITAEHSTGFRAVLHIDFRGYLTCSPNPGERFNLYAETNSHAARMSWWPEDSVPDTGVAGFPYPHNHPELLVALALYVVTTLDHDAPLTKVTMSRGLPL